MRELLSALSSVDAASWLGYSASAVVALSLMMTKTVILRWVNLAGALLFAVYGVLIASYPVAFLNAFIVVTNTYYLFKAYTAKEYFRLLPIKADSEYLAYFLSFNEKEIARYAPRFAYAAKEADVRYFVLRDLVPAGLFVGKRVDEKTLAIILDFVLPQYRDYKAGAYLYRRFETTLARKGVARIIGKAETTRYAMYLKRMGFQEGEEKGWYVKEILPLHDTATA